MQDPLATLSLGSRRRFLVELVLVVAVFGGLLAMMTIDQAIGSGPGPKIFVLVRMAALLLLCTWLLHRGGERWADVGLRRPARWWSVPLLLVAGTSAFLVIALTTHPVLGALGIEPPRVDHTALRGDLIEYLYWAGPVSWGTAAFGEELLLRGFILDRIIKVIGSSRLPAVLVSIVLQAAVFGSLHVHQGLGGVIVTGTIGVLFGLMWLLGGRNLWACIVLHGLINSISHYEAYSLPSS